MMNKLKKWLVSGALLLSTLTLGACQSQQIAKDQQQNNQQTQQTKQQNNTQTTYSQGIRPSDKLAASVLTPAVKQQLGGGNFTYNGMGAYDIYNGSKLNVNVSSAPYVQLPKRNPAHGNRLEGSARAWLNKSSRQYKNRQETGNGATSWKPVGFKQRMKLNAQKALYTHLYDRGHLIAYAIAGNVKHFDASEANVNNIVTETAWANEAAGDEAGTGQNYYEGMVRRTLDQNQSVMYVVTPIYNSDQDLVPAGIHLQAATKDRELFNVFVPNVQTGLKINYQTGQSTITY